MKKGIAKKALALCFVMAVILEALVVVLEVSVSADVSGDFQYSVINGGSNIEITGYTGLGGNVVIPGTIDGKPVTSIGDYAFLDDNLMLSISLPSTLNKIGKDAFSGCSGLTSITIPNSVTTIEDAAFYDCSSLTSVTVPESVTHLGEMVFLSCTNLTSVILPSTLTSISNQTFQSCTKLPSITLGDTVTSIGFGAFNGCEQLRSIVIPGQVKTIDEWAFKDCTNLTSINIPDAVKTIGIGAFEGCTALTSISIGNDVTELGNDAFSGCISLSSITLGSSVSIIGSGAFYKCSMTTISLPTSVTSVYSGSFSGCSFLQSINVNAGNQDYYSIDGVLYGKIPNVLMMCPYTKSGAIVIPNDVTEIEGGAFADCRYITSITVGSSVNTIGPWAFTGCDSLTSITFLGLTAPKNVDDYSFSAMSSDVIGHAFANSNFPSPGGTFYGLPMGKTITDFDVPTAPINTEATPGNGFVSITWDAPTGDGGSQITSYKIYRAIDNGNPSLLDSTNDRSYTDSSIQSGRTYYYSISALNSRGESERSASVSAAPMNTISAPSVPQNVIATVANGNVSLQWSASSKDGGAPITGYNVYRGVTPDGLTLLAKADLSYSDNTTIKGTTYYYVIRAVNSVGEGAKSAITKVVISIYSPPSAPIGFSATANGGRIVLIWGAPNSDGGSPVTEYRIYRGPNVGTMTFLATTYNTTYEDNDVKGDVTYYYYVVAVNEAGEGQRSSVVSTSIVSFFSAIINFMTTSVVVPLAVSVVGGLFVIYLAEHYKLIDRINEIFSRIKEKIKKP